MAGRRNMAWFFLYLVEVASVTGILKGKTWNTIAVCLILNDYNRFLTGAESIASDND